jgi:alpha-L-fucosidase 2
MAHFEEMLQSKAVFFARSLAATGWAKSYQDVEYARPEGQPLRFDATVPEGKGPHPAVIIVHGGAWVTGDKQYSVQPLFQPLTQAGMAWFSINYRLARELNFESLISLGTLGSLQAAISDVRVAVAYIREHAAEYNIDPARIALVGESAGAHLALMAALKPEPGGEVNAVVGFYAPSDMVDLVQSSKRIPDQIREMVRGTPLEALLLAGLRNVSPRFFVEKDSPPIFLIHGTADTLVPLKQSEDMCETAKEKGAACALHIVDGGGHGLRGWERGSLSGYKSLLTEWLTRHFRGPQQL